MGVTLSYFTFFCFKVGFYFKKYFGVLLTLFGLVSFRIQTGFRVRSCAVQKGNATAIVRSSLSFERTMGNLMFLSNHSA